MNPQIDKNIKIIFKKPVKGVDLTIFTCAFFSGNIFKKPVILIIRVKGGRRQALVKKIS